MLASSSTRVRLRFIVLWVNMMDRVEEILGRLSLPIKLTPSYPHAPIDSLTIRPHVTPSWGALSRSTSFSFSFHAFPLRHADGRLPAVFPTEGVCSGCGGLTRLVYLGNRGGQETDRDVMNKDTLSEKGGRGERSERNNSR